MNQIQVYKHNYYHLMNNHYQKRDNKPVQEIQNKALIEFDNMVEKLKKVGIDVKVMQDTKEPHTPDSIFPNNWFSTHYSNTVVLYPMSAENRRLERTDTIYDYFDKVDNLNVVDYSSLENISSAIFSLLLMLPPSVISTKPVLHFFFESNLS